jgi:outer membrane protein TolC
MAAANAQIGVAKAAFFPSLTLNGTIGWESTALSSLISAPSLVWTIGTMASQVVFDGGRRSAAVDFANQGYVAAVANYRQTVLGAFQQVQDGIVGLSVLDGAQKKSHAAVARERSLFGRPRRLSRRDHRAAAIAHERASGCADSRAAAHRVGGAREGTGRRVERE